MIHYSDVLSHLRSHPFKWQGIDETQRFLLLSILIGVFAGLLIVCFHITMDFISWLSFEPVAGTGIIRTLLSPVIGALIAVFLIHIVFPAAKGSGVNDTKAAVYISDGVVPFNAIAGKFLSCSISIGMGNSLGPEDPSLHMGAGIASFLGRIFRFPRETMRLIAPVGAAAGLAAAFNTPIAAVIFVIEEIVAGWSAGVLGSIVLAAVSATVVVRWFLGNHPLFQVPEFQLASFSELLVYALVGVAGGLFSVLFVKLVGRLRRRLAHLPSHTVFVKAAASGLVVGLAGIWLPQVMGAGYGNIDGALHGQYSWQMLLILSIVKMAATLICFSAGTPGGMFAPTLFIGAMLGGGIGGLAQTYWPFSTSAVSAYVLVGMGTFFAGVFRAPMTSIFMVFEVSASYVIILPVMVANTISYLISRRMQKAPFFTMIARDEGLDLPSLEERREGHTLQVENAMSPPLPAMPDNTLLAKALHSASPNGCVLITRPGDTFSCVTRKDLESAIEAGAGDRALREAFLLEPLPTLHPDLSLEAALRLFDSHAVLPVVSRSHPRRLLGTLTLGDVCRAYGIEKIPQQLGP